MSLGQQIDGLARKFVGALHGFVFGKAKPNAQRKAKPNAPRKPQIAPSKIVHSLSYLPLSGKKSPKARRLAEFCLADFLDVPVAPFQDTKAYREAGFHIRMIVKDNEVQLTSKTFEIGEHCYGVIDQKKSITQLIQNQIKFPEQLKAWIVRGDDAGDESNLDLGAHFCVARHPRHTRHILLPAGDRDRFQGRQLASYMAQVKADWTAWDQKSDTVWWGGAVTGMYWDANATLLTRQRLLLHFADHPESNVILRPTVDPAQVLPSRIGLYPDFTKAEAFKHKAIMLMPGNDAPSGAVWYFAGNSVVMMPEAPIDHVLGFELTPWEHYIPVGPDPNDVLVKLQWVLDNPQKAQQIVRAAHQNLRWHSGDEYIWAMNTVLAEAGAHIARSN